ncbi:MAG: 2-isopropylmalate synthase [Candidatus Omnitrophota bacterium]
MLEINIGEGLKKMAIGVFIDAVKKSGRVLISDTTLRDGEQAPGASLSIDQKVEIAKQLDKLGVDAIEAGFPASSKEEMEAVKQVAKKVRRPTITVLSRCHKGDIDAAVEALKGAKQWGLALFLGTSPMLRQHSLGNKSKEDIIEIVRDSIKYAKKFTDNIGFGAEDAARTESQFLYRIYEEAIYSGALVIGFPDTVGWLVPEDTKKIIKGIKKNVRNMNKALLGIHFHNDLGLAVANSLTAIQNGANIIQCTINGVGERAGNASLEEIVMALKTRENLYNIKTNIKTKELFKTSQLVEKYTGMCVSPNKAIVGRNVFASEAGIHQTALLKDRLTYEIIKPEDVGQDGTTFVLGRHSGKNMIIHKLNELGFKLDEELNQATIEMIYQKFKELAVTKKIVKDSELANVANAVLKEK